MKDTFLLHINEGARSGSRIFYAPLKGFSKIIETEEDIASAMKEASALPNRNIYHISADPDEFRTLMVLPNNRCNFHCAYCYSAKGRSNTEMTSMMLRKTLEWFITPKRLPGKKLTLIYIGGGEPLLSWPVVKESISYALELNAKREGDIYISIVTNCSIINEDIIQFCLNTNAGICASYDILEDVQNKLRGHYDQVTANINEYSSRGVDVGLTTVITEDNIHRMKEMVQVMKQAIPLVKQVQFKPLVPDESFVKFASKDDYYKAFVDEFFEAKALADKEGIRLTCPYFNAVSVLQDRFCEGKFVLAADGNITGCNFVSSPLEKQFDTFKTGYTNEDGVSIDEDSVKRIFSHNNDLEICNDCSAKYHCAGGCYADHVYMSQDDKEAYCRAMRLFLTKYLILKNLT